MGRNTRSIKGRKHLAKKRKSSGGIAYGLILLFPLFMAFHIATAPARHPYSDGTVIPAATPKPTMQYNSDDWMKMVKGDTESVHCLAWNIYFEARGTSDADQVAVANVTVNRLASPKYQNSVCKVVFAPFAFSWTHNKALLHQKVDQKAWKKAVDIAQKVLYGETRDNTRGATNYYNPRKVNPGWAKSGYDVVELEGHRYMKLKNGI